MYISDKTVISALVLHLSHTNQTKTKIDFKLYLTFSCVFVVPVQASCWPCSYSRCCHHTNAPRFVQCTVLATLEEQSSVLVASQTYQRTCRSAHTCSCWSKPT